MPQINFLNNLSSKYTQEFSLAVIRFKRLNNPFIVKVFVRLCVIQFTRYRSLSTGAESFFSLAQLPLVVKNFFHFLSTFFSALCAVLRPLPEALVYNTKHTFDCQPLFSLFSIIFSAVKTGSGSSPFQCFSLGRCPCTFRYGTTSAISIPSSK